MQECHACGSSLWRSFPERDRNVRHALQYREARMGRTTRICPARV